MKNGTGIKVQYVMQCHAAHRASTLAGIRPVSDPEPLVPLA